MKVQFNLRNQRSCFLEHTTRAKKQRQFSSLSLKTGFTIVILDQPALDTPEQLPHALCNFLCPPTSWLFKKFESLAANHLIPGETSFLSNHLSTSLCILHSQRLIKSISKTNNLHPNSTAPYRLHKEVSDRKDIWFNLTNKT